ncbi:EMC6-like membrane protein [Methanosphaera sp.]
MDEITIMSYEHIIGGIAAGIISYLFSVKGILPITNEFIGVIISIVIVYGLGKLAENKYGREKISLSSWIMNGILPFYFMWMVVWIMLLNYVVL